MKIVKFVSLMLAVLLLVGCAAPVEKPSQDKPDSSGTEQSAPEKPSTDSMKDTFVYAIKSDLTSFDPYKAGDLTTLAILYNIYDPLVRTDDDGNIVPCLATEWEMNEAVDEYLFTIDTEIVWHTGDKLTVDDIVYSFERAMQTPNMNSKTNMIASVEAVGNKQVKISLNGPYAPFLYNITQIYMMNKAATEAAGESIDNPVGTGPFAFVSFVPGSKAEFVRHDAYHGEPAKVQKLEIRIITDAATRALSLEAGDVDMTMTLDTIDYPIIEANPDLVLDAGAQAMFYYVALNNKVEPFANVKVRKAIAHAIDFESLNIAVFEGFGAQANQPLTERSFGYSDKYSFPTYDLEKAKALMAEAGYADGFNTSIICYAGQTKLAAEALHSMLKEINIDLSINVVEFSSAIASLSSGDYEMGAYGWTDLVGDADNVLRLLFSTNTQGVAGNVSFYSNPAYDAIVEDAKVSTDPERRKELYEQALQIITEECPIVPLYFLPGEIAYHKSVKGISFSRILTFDLAKVYFE